ncbi:hypothetical protein ACFL01_00755 [Planctomycetota bacterium]
MSALAVVWCMAALFCFSREALAHRVNIFASEENGKIVTESFSSSGKRCKGAKISVFGGNDILLLEGTTDDDGMFSFDSPGKDVIRIVLDAGLGHRAEYALSVGNVSSSGDAGDVPDDPASERKGRAGTLNPEGVCLRDVIGGLGWIVGIMGIVMYIRSRKSGKE